MGLDIYLYGEKFLMNDNILKDDTYPVRFIRLEVGQWRKDWGLHSYVIDNFANGVDEAQEIVLSKENLNQIIEALRTNQLKRTPDDPRELDPSYDMETVSTLRKALSWLDVKQSGIMKSLIYRGSW